jgi:hypothetical protein
MTDPTISASELVMARKACASIWEHDGSKSVADDVRAGIYDHTQQVRSALAAIRATTERAAVLAEGCAPVVQCMSVEPIVSVCFDIATKLRLGQHLESTI